MANPVRSIFSALHALIRKVLGLSKKKKVKVITNLPIIHKKKTCSIPALEKRLQKEKRKRKRKGKDHDDKD
jgi:hypothetical protein